LDIVIDHADVALRGTSLKNAEDRKMLGGYTGKILRVNLSNRRVSQEQIPEETMRKYVGGSGLAAKILYEETSQKTDPLGPENLLVFMTGPLTGTKVPLSGRHQVAFKSPLTGIYGEADVGGEWGTQLKKAGYDGIVVGGKAPEPVYIWISEGDVEIRDAHQFWGMDTYEIDHLLKQETDSKAVVQSIGPAGEKLARIAAIMTGGRDGRALARCGPGAVMGSKNLKAMVARGLKEVPVVHVKELTLSIKELGGMVVRNQKFDHQYGTSGGANSLEYVGDLPIRNWIDGEWKEGAEKITGETWQKAMLTGYYYCGACVVGCGREVKLSTGRYAGVDGAGPEYETVAMLGAVNLVDDMEALLKAHETCNRLGLDVISTGAVVGFATEAYERGFITSKDTDGIELAWGNADAMVEMVNKIGRRIGIGFLLGEGVKRAAEALGGATPEFAIHTKGLELPGHDPRAHPSQGLSFATSNRGACHLAGATHWFEKGVTMTEIGLPEYTLADRFKVEGKGAFVAKLQDLMCLFDSVKLCKFILFGGIKVHHMVDWLNYVTGWNMSVEEFMQAGERTFNLKRLYNVREGITRKDDTLPPRILVHKRGSGGAAESLPNLGEMLNQYYRARGWDEMGIPSAAKLRELGIEFPFELPPIGSPSIKS
jgi:aldehyde:ferredoxin oxidoreductase